MLKMGSLKSPVVLAATTVLTGFAIVAGAPSAQARMGTGQPAPPPPPPPFDVNGRMFEQSSADPDLSGKGFGGLLVNHTVSAVDGTATKVTGTNGTFSYQLREGQTVSHSGYMFGVTRSSTTQEIAIPTDATLKIVVAGDEKDYNANASSGLTWKASYTVVRGEATDASYTSQSVTWDQALRGFSRQVARNVKATPQFSGTGRQLVTFKLTGLIAERNGGEVLSWADDKKNGIIELAPGETKTLTLHKIYVIAPK